MNNPQSKLSRHRQIQHHHLLGFWKKYWALEPLPQLDRWLAQQFSENKSYGKKDRTFFSESLFFLVRHALLILLLDEIKKHPGSKDSFQKIVQEMSETSQLRVKLRTIDPLPYLVETDEMRRHLSEILSGFEVDPFYHELILAGLPPQLNSELEKRIVKSAWTHDQSSLFLQRQLTRPPVWLRCNRLSDKSAILQELQEKEARIVAEQGLAIAVTIKQSLYDLNCFKQGLFELQDLASQKIGEVCAVRPGETVWDVCAGGGGKTVQLAAAMQNKGLLCATEVRSYKLAEAKRRLKRAGYFNIQTYDWDGKNIPVFSGQSQLKFDCILIDAPCSGSGTWRRNPDGKLRLSQKEIEDLSGIQLGLLNLVSGRLKPGGRIVYATCSFFVEENEDVIERFLQTHPQFELVAQSLHGSPAIDADTTFTATIIIR